MVSINLAVAMGIGLITGFVLLIYKDVHETIIKWAVKDLKGFKKELARLLGVMVSLFILLLMWLIAISF